MPKKVKRVISEVVVKKSAMARHHRCPGGCRAVAIKSSTYIIADGLVNQFSKTSVLLMLEGNASDALSHTNTSIRIFPSETFRMNAGGRDHDAPGDDKT